MSIGEGIRKRRLELGMTQTDLAQKVFKVRQAITNIELNNRGVSSRDLLRFCAALQTDPNTLFQYKTEK